MLEEWKYGNHSKGSLLTRAWCSHDGKGYPGAFSKQLGSQQVEAGEGCIRQEEPDGYAVKTRADRLILSMYEDPV